MRRVAERTYVVLALVYFSGAFAQRDASDDPTQGNLPMFVLQAVVYLVAGLYMFRWWRAVAQGLRHAKWAVVLSVYAMLSAGWSGEPLFSLRKAAVVVATTLFGVYLGSAFRREAQLRMMCWAFAVMATLSIIAAVAFPQYGVDHLYHEGDWQGIYSQKNALGRLMVLGTLVFLLCPSRDFTESATRLFGALVCCGVMLMSGSKTALLIAVAILVAAPFYRVLSMRRATAVVPLLMTCFLLTTCAALVLWENSGALLSLLGRDETLTGRTPLWASALAAIYDRPWGGYGFGGFWLGLTGPSLSVITDVGWMAPHAHNGYLDLCLDLGLVGLVVFLIGLATRFRIGLQECMPRRRETLWPVLLLTLMVLYNVNETSILRVNNLLWIMYVAVLSQSEVPDKSTRRGVI